MASLSFRCRRQRTGKDGHVPSVLRISHNGIRKFVSTDVRVDPKKWRDKGRDLTTDVDINTTIRRANRQGYLYLSVAA